MCAWGANKKTPERAPKYSVVERIPHLHLYPRVS